MMSTLFDKLYMEDSMSWIIILEWDFYIIVVGHETSASNLTWTLLEILNNPAILNRWLDWEEIVDDDFIKRHNLWYC